MDKLTRRIQTSKSREKNEISINTHIGVLTAFTNSDENYPGIYIQFGKEHNIVACVEVVQGDESGACGEIRAVVWENANEDDFSHLIPINILEQVELSESMSSEEQKEIVTTPKIELTNDLEISKILTLSTGHISEETSIHLNLDNLDVPVFQKSEYGWFIYVSDDDYENTPDDLKAILLLARDNNCDWVCLDRDGLVINELHHYDW